MSDFVRYQRACPNERSNRHRAKALVLAFSTMTRRLWAVAAALWVALGSPAWAWGADFDFNDGKWGGSSELLELAREKLGRHRVEIVATLDWSELTPADGVLILHPTVDIQYDDASAFLRAGGRLAVLDDHGTAPSLLEHFHIYRENAPIRPAMTLRRNADFAIAVPAVQQVAGYEQGRHPIVANVKQLVTNHPTALRHPDLTQVLKIPTIGENEATLAITGIIVNKGRLFAMSDPSAVINLMMRYPGNRAFAEGLVEYLVEDDGDTIRTGRLFLLANDFTQTGHYGGSTSLGRELKEELEAFGKIVDESRKKGLPDIVALLLSVVVALGAMLWVGVVASRTYRRLAPRYAREVPLVAQGGVAGRAAVLASPSTHRALALLELKSALEEGLCHRLGIEGRPSPSSLRAEINRQEALSRRSSEDLGRVMAELSDAETAVVASQPIRVTARMVERMRKRVTQLLDEVTERTGAQS